MPFRTGEVMQTVDLSPARLDLDAIHAALREVQAQFPTINALLASPRDTMGDTIVDNMMAGYVYVDEQLAAGVDILAMGNLHHLLELNARVLCGTDETERARSAGHLEATEARFYDDEAGGIRELAEWYRMHRDDSCWKRASGTYVRVLSDPQLYIEGNHRTGALIMSWILAREGRPPFVLTVRNAKAYFDPSTTIKRTKRTPLTLLYRLPKIKKAFGAFLKEQADTRFLKLPMEVG